MRSIKCISFVLVILFLSACSNTRFQSTWHAPSAPSVNLRQKSAAAFLISGNETVRRSFESNLANDLTQRGIETLPGYEVLPNTDVTNKDQVLTKLRNTHSDVAIFMRIDNRRQEITFVRDPWYRGPYYDRFWWRNGVFYGPRYRGAWPGFRDAGYFETDTVVSVSTTIYSVPDSKLLWTGSSETLNPSKVEGFVKELASQTVKKLKDVGMLRAAASTTALTERKL